MWRNYFAEETREIKHVTSDQIITNSSHLQLVHLSRTSNNGFMAHRFSESEFTKVEIFRSFELFRKYFDHFVDSNRHYKYMIIN